MTSEWEATAGNETMNETDIVIDKVFNGIHAGVWAILTLLVLFLNGVCLAILPKVKNIHESTKIFLACMTIGDLTLGVFYYLPMIGVSLAGSTWPYGAFCYVQAWVVRQGLIVSCGSAFLVTVDRYVAIMYSLRYENLVTKRRAQITTCCFVVVCNLYALGGLLLNLQDTVFNDDIQTCVFGSDNLIQNTLTMSSQLFIVGAILMMYLKILKTASKHAVHIEAQRNHAERHRPIAALRRSFITFLIITSIFIVGWMPFSFVTVTASAGFKGPPIISRVARLLFASVSWLNVLIYYIRNRDFRQEMHIFVKKMKKRCC